VSGIAATRMRGSTDCSSESEAVFVADESDAQLGQHKSTTRVIDSTVTGLGCLTTLRISCERPPNQPMDELIINDGTMRSNLPFPQRSTVFMRLLDGVSHSRSRNLCDMVSNFTARALVARSWSIVDNDVPSAMSTSPFSHTVGA